MLVLSDFFFSARCGHGKGFGAGSYDGFCCTAAHASDEFLNIRKVFCPLFFDNYFVVDFLSQ